MLLASDMHLGSAERSERQVQHNKYASECPRHCGGYTGSATAADPAETVALAVIVFLRVGSAMSGRNFGEAAGSTS